MGVQEESTGADEGADHIWGADDGEEEPGHEQLDREWRARREEHFSGGYREGLEAGKHETVQEGFDEGYRLGAAAGFECGAARGAAATLRALAPRLPADLRSRLQEVEQEQGQGGQQLADMPYQQLQQQVCSGLMAGAPPQPPAAAAAAPVPGCQLLPSVDASLQSLCSALRRVGLQPPEKAVIE